MRALGQWFIRHWLLGTLAIIVVLWLATGVAYRAGVSGFTVRTRGGQTATVDFSRDFEVAFWSLGRGAVLQIRNSSGGGVISDVRSTAATPIPLCWLCGDLRTTTPLAQVEFRAGAWLYLTPRDAWPSGLEKWPAASRDAYRALAYNSVSGERVLVAVGATVPAQLQALAQHGLAPDDRARLGPAALQDLAEASIMREGCMVMHVAFLATIALWLMLGGAVALLLRLRRGKRAV